VRFSARNIIMKLMREKVLVIGFGVLLAVAYGQRQQPSPAVPVVAQNRYQIVAGSNLVGDSTVYRIDTATGRTWMATVKAGRNGIVWMVVDEDPDAAKRP
jgi:hypothetical protein